jgi:hypothetical protein
MIDISACFCHGGGSQFESLSTPPPIDSAPLGSVSAFSSATLSTRKYNYHQSYT